MRANDIFKLIIAVVLSEAAGIIGSAFTISEIPSWYAGLQKPSLNPPSWLFGPVWTTLYFLMGVAAFLVWRQGWSSKDVRRGLGIFAFQLVLNAFWSVIFFGWHRPGLALLDLVALWVAILWMISSFRKISRTAAWLLLPYLLWVSFAAYLNFSIWKLN